jgi:hypothetical protein
MKASFAELGKTISRWPQIGSEVTMGGGIVASTVRIVLLGNSSISGRKYLDISEFNLD